MVAVVKAVAHQEERVAAPVRQVRVLVPALQVQAQVHLDHQVLARSQGRRRGKSHSHYWHHRHECFPSRKITYTSSSQYFKHRRSNNIWLRNQGILRWRQILRRWSKYSLRFWSSLPSRHITLPVPSCRSRVLWWCLGIRSLWLSIPQPILLPQSQQHQRQLLDPSHVSLRTIRRMWM